MIFFWFCAELFTRSRRYRRRNRCRRRSKYRSSSRCRSRSRSRSIYIRWIGSRPATELDKTWWMHWCMNGQGMKLPFKCMVLSHLNVRHKIWKIVTGLYITKHWASLLGFQKHFIPYYVLAKTKFDLGLFSHKPCCLCLLKNQSITAIQGSLWSCCLLWRFTLELGCSWLSDDC